MPKLYHVDIARHAATADHKWIDNLLSHFDVPGVEGGRQGSPRRITADGIQHIALVRILTSELGLSVAESNELAPRLLSADSAPISLGNGLELRLDLAEFRVNVNRLITDGVESVAPARRGRPPKR